MNSLDYPIFCTLVKQVYQKAFQEPLAPLPFKKATALSFIIEEITGQLISYKTLQSYVRAVSENRPHQINPNISTLDILACFVRNEHTGKFGLAWFHFRDFQIKNARSIARPGEMQLLLQF